MTDSDNFLVRNDLSPHQVKYSTNNESISDFRVIDESEVECLVDGQIIDIDLRRMEMGLGYVFIRSKTSHRTR